MSLTVSPDEGFMPILYQILSFLCYSPVCSVSQSIKKGKLKDVHTTLGIVRMIIGVLNIAVGIAFACLGSWLTMYKIAQAPFWLGNVFFAVGIVCVLAARSSHFCMLIIGMIVNIVSAALAITTVVLYSVDLVNNNAEDCESYSSSYLHYDNGYDYKAPSSEIRQDCQYHGNLIKMIFGGLDIMMIVLSVFHICVTISFCVLTGKALCKKDDDVKLLEHPEIHKLLLEDDTPGLAC